jgi:hypothetical protein
MKTIRGDFVWLGLSSAIITYDLTLVNGNDFRRRIAFGRLAGAMIELGCHYARPDEKSCVLANPQYALSDNAG